MPPSMAFAAHSNRPQPLWQPPATAHRTAAAAAPEASLLPRHPCSALPTPVHCRQVMEDVPASLEDLRDTAHRGLADSFLTGSGLNQSPESAEKLLQLGHMYYTLFKDFRSGIVCLEHALHIYQQSKDTEGLQALPLQYLGDLYLNLRDWKKARQYFDRCVGGRGRGGRASSEGRLGMGAVGKGAHRALCPALCEKSAVFHRVPGA